MASSSRDVPEARGSSHPFERHPWFHHAQTQADALFVKWCRSWRHGTEFEDAIAVLENAFKYAETLPNIEPAVPAGLLRRQAAYYNTRYFRQGKELDAKEAARCLHKVLQYEPADTSTMSQLSWIYVSQASFTGSRMMLDDAIGLSENAIVQTQANHEAFPSTLTIAAQCLIERAQFDGCHEDLAIAAQLLRVGLALPNLAGEDPAGLRLLLAEIHLLQFESSENPEDIDRVSSSLGEVPSTYSVQVQHEVYLNELRGKMYKAKWEFFRTKQDLVASLLAYMASHRAIVNNTACPSWSDIDAVLGCADLLTICSKQYKSDYLLSKSFLLANEACRLARKRALDWHLSSIPRVEAQAHFIKGKTLRQRYRRYHATQLLENAVSAFRQSVRMTDLKDANFAERVYNLSAVLRMRSKADQLNHYQRQAYLSEARHWFGKLIWSRMPLRRWQQVGCALGIGHLLRDSGAPVARVIPLYQRAVELDTMHFVYRVDSWRSLAEALISQGQNTKCIEDLHTARAYLDKIEILERERNDRYSGRLPVAASLQTAYYQLTGDFAYRVQAAYINHTIFSKSRYPLVDKIEAAEDFMNFSIWFVGHRKPDIEEMLRTMSMEFLDSIDHCKAAEECVDLMNRLISECHDQAQQLFIIREARRLPKIWVSSAIAAGRDAVTIVNALEKGRSVLWDRLINRKGQVVELAEKHEELASQYRDLRKKMDQTAQADNNFKGQPQDKYLLESEMNDLVATIRQQDGFTDFLLPPLGASKLQSYGAHGPIVMLVAQEPIGYASVASKDFIFTVPLRGYTPEACQRHFQLLRRSLDPVCSPQDQVRAADSLYQVLTWLWESAAEPVLDRLGFVGSWDPSEGPPHLWWITCDWVNRLPIHAAGDHLRRLRTNEPCTVMDRVISSYSPTLKALMYSRTRMQELVKQSSTTTEPPTALLAAMEETMDRPKLEDAVREVKCVQPILEPQFHIRSFTNPPPTRKDIVTNLRKCTIAHLACHGEADPSDPLRSKILLQDWGPKPLRVAFIMRMDMENCQLAYLSACETAVNKDEKLAEEGLHISGAFQMAGVPNTVATWWEINDQEAVAVAEGFYGRLRDGGGRIDVGRAAGALRGALVEMRDAGVSPLVWGSYVHFGG